jgi:hypothetical protein
MITPSSTIVAEGLRKLRDARLAEVEALSLLLQAVTDNSGPASGPPPSTLEAGNDEFLSLRQLAARIPYAEKTISNLKSEGKLQEGLHWSKPRGRVMYSWKAMQEWVRQEQHAQSAADALPLSRTAKRGRQG